MYARPSELNETLALIAEPGARLLAGGTDVFPGAGERPLTGCIIDISQLPSLKGITHSDDEIRIGAGTTWTDLVRAELPPAFDALRAAAREIGAVQIQNRGTIGGNLCNASPAADGVPPLLILDAEVELVSGRGARRLPLAQFITGNRRTLLGADELLTAIILPAPATGMRSTFLKLGARRYLVISIAMVAVLLDIREGVVRGARLAIGSCSAVAQRLPAAEASLIGRKADAAIGAVLVAQHLAALSPIDDVRATAVYRRDAALTLLRRALESCVRGEAGGVA
ncbi:MAG TPA: xanthine dehydrogenase family protein subunit M [Roseiarcus sp.]